MENNNTKTLINLVYQFYNINNLLDNNIIDSYKNYSDLYNYIKSKIQTFDSNDFLDFVYEELEKNNEYYDLLLHLDSINCYEATRKIGVCYYYGTITKEDKTKAIEYFKKAADNDEMVSQHNMGVIYYDGELIKQNYELALNYFEKSVSKGYIKSYGYIGYMYLYGQFVDKDVEKGIKYLEYAANNNDTQSQYKLALFYKELLDESEETIEKDNIDKAIFWFEKVLNSTSEDPSEIYFHLGDIYDSYLESKETNKEQAIKYFKQSLNYQEMCAEYRIGYIYFNDYIDTKENIEESIYWFKQGVEKGHDYSKFMLARIYAKYKEDNKDYQEQANYWYQETFNIEDKEAKYRLAQSYIDNCKDDIEYIDRALSMLKEIVSEEFYSPANDIGLIYKDNKLIKDYDVAAKWFEFGVKYNDKYALYNYGNLYTYNDFISKSYVKAEKLYQKALEIDSDYILPYEGLGKLYYYGDGDLFEIDFIKAKEYFVKAKELGGENNYLLELIESRLNNIDKTNYIFELAKNNSKQEYKQEIKKLFYVSIFSKESKEFLNTALIMYYNHLEDELVDYSPIIVEISKILEVELKKYFIDDYSKYIYKTGKKVKINNNIYYNFTLGNFKDLINRKETKNEELKFYQEKSQRLKTKENRYISFDRTILKYLEEELFDLNNFSVDYKEEIFETLENLYQNVEQIASYRNDSAHKKIVSKETAEFILNLLLFKEKTLLNFFDKIKKDETEEEIHQASRGDTRMQVSAAIRYEDGDGVEKDLEKAKYLYELAANNGDEDAKVFLGSLILEDEENLNKEKVEKAIYWLESATKDNYNLASTLLFNVYYNGIHVDKDIDKALSWLEKAASSGDLEAQKKIADVYNFDLEYKEKAIYWYEQAAKQGDNISQYNLGLYYSEIEDFQKAIYWFELAANQEYNDAIFELGQIYKYDLEETEENYRKAYSLFETLAIQDDVNAIFQLGHMIYYTAERTIKNINEAMYWLEKAANQDDARALYFMGIIYYENPDLFEDYFEKAENYLKKAVDKDESNAFYYLGMLYLNNTNKNKKYIEKAIEYLTKSAEGNDPDACYELGLLYENNEDKNDITKAVYWYEQAMENNNIKAFMTLGCIYMQDYEEISKAMDIFKKGEELNDVDCKYMLAAIAYDGIHEPRDLEKAKKYLEQGVYEEDRDSLHLLASIYLAENDYKQKLDTIISLLEKSADKGKMEAEEMLGDIYIQELGDIEKGIYWYNQAIEKNSSRAIFALASLNFNQLGNYKEAIELYEKGAQLGEDRCQYMVGAIAYDGIHEPRDLEKAKYWFEKVTENEDNSFYNFACLYLFKTYQYQKNKEKAKEYKIKYKQSKKK